MAQGAIDVSDSTFSIITAFTSCRDVLRKIRARRHHKIGQQQPSPKEGELKLNQSLRRGPQEIEDHYAAGLQAVGQPFEMGDAHARSELTSILLRLNAGLVDIISGFLKKKDPSKLKLDYQALTTLSDASRDQARDALAALARRLSVANALHSAVSPAIKQRREVAVRRGSHGDGKKSPHKRHRSIPVGDYIAISKRKNETQTAFVRPRLGNKRKISSDASNSSKKEGEAKINSPKRPKDALVTSIPGSPDALKPRQAERQLNALSDAFSHRPLDMSEPQRSAKITQVEGAQKPRMAPMHPPDIQQPLRVNPDSPTQIGRPGRAAANRDTVYTYASESTKLGEIPMHRWTIPFDFEEAERMNAEAETASWVAMQQAAKAKKRPGLLKRLFKRQPLAAVVEA